MPAKKFGSLLSAPPKPLPDDDEVPEVDTIEVVEEPEEPEKEPEPQPEPVATAPAPEEPVAVGEQEPSQAAAQPATAAPVEQSVPPVQPEQPHAAPPAVAAAPVAVPAPESNGATAPEQPSEQAGRQVPLTLRLHAPAARAFRDAWFDERRTNDPMLSSPEFASKIVMLGLDAYNKKLQR